MNGKQLGILLVLVAVLGGAGWMIYQKQNAERSAGNSGIGKKLLAGFPVNEVAHITIKQGTNEVNLVRKDDAWRVSERHDYPANFSQIRDFLIKLPELKAVQMEPVGPSQLPRLQLAAPGQGTNSALAVEFKGQNGKPINTLLLGKLHMSSRGASPMGESEGGWPDGRYVKVGAGATDVAVISDPFENIEPKPEQWLNKDFFKVEKARSVEVIFPAAANSWKLTRETEPGEWKLADAKADEQMDSAKTADVSSPFSSPAFDDVMPGAKLDEGGTNQPTLVTIETFDDFRYVAKVGQKSGDHYPVVVSVAAQIARERAPANEEKPEDKARLDKEFKERLQKLEEKLKQEQSCGAWTYLVSGGTVEPLLKERSQLLAAKKEEPKPDEKAATGEPKLEDPPLPAILPTP